MHKVSNFSDNYCSIIIVAEHSSGPDQDLMSVTYDIDNRSSHDELSLQ